MSTGEIVLILVIYLMFFGAKGIPSLAQTMGKAVHQFRNAARDVQTEILQSADQMRKEAQQIRLDQVDIDEPTLANENKIHQPALPPPPPKDPAEEEGTA